MYKKSHKVNRDKLVLILVGVVAVGLAALATLRPAQADMGRTVVIIEGAGGTSQGGAGEHHLVLTGGMTQSGSTLQYNIVRMLMESLNPEDFIAGYVWNVENRPRHKYAVLKCHDCKQFLNNPRWSSKTVFTIHRDIRDVAVSRRRKGYNHTVAELMKLRTFYETVAHQANADWQYEDVMKNGEEFVHDTAALLNQNVPGIHIGEVDAAGILAKIREAATDFKGHHEISKDGKVKADQFQFYTQYIRDGTWGSFKKVFNQSMCLSLSSAFEDYLKEHKYPLQEAC